jgi:hypothetical protein
MKIIDALICAAQEGKCFYCGGEFRGQRVTERRKSPRPDKWTRDHLFPVSQGGGKLRNIVLACEACNTGKKDRAPTENEIVRAARVFATVERLLRCMTGDEWDAHLPACFKWPREELPAQSKLAEELSRRLDG